MVMTSYLFFTGTALFLSILVGLYSYLFRQTEKFSLTIHSYKNAYRNHGLLPILDQSLTKLSQCELVHINIFYRHGTRTPSIIDLENSLQFHKRLMKSKSTIIPQKLVNYAKEAISPKNEKQLSDVGKEEFYLMGQRMSHRYSGRIIGSQRNFTESNTYFRSSKKSRALDSGAYFIKGMFPHKNDILSNRKMVHIDDIMIRFYDMCPKYQATVLNNETVIEEYYKFVEGPEVRRVIREIQDKFDLHDVELTPDDLKTIYSLCGVDIANNASLLPEDSAWCPLMTDNQRIVAEYMADIKRYYQYGYGFDLTMRQSCRLLGPMLEDAMRAIADIESPRAVFTFGHGEGVTPLVALLGLFNQSEKPTADNFHRIIQLDDHSRFRLSRIATFGANVGFAVFSCPNDDKSNIEYRVQPLMNEQSVYWDVCGSTHCGWQEFVDKFKFCLTPPFDFSKTCSYPG